VIVLVKLRYEAATFFLLNWLVRFLEGGIQILDLRFVCIGSFAVIVLTKLANPCFLQVVHATIGIDSLLFQDIVPSWTLISRSMHFIVSSVRTILWVIVTFSGKKFPPFGKDW
jgi:hypothetical protein